jgi:hypothetical protein
MRKTIKQKLAALCEINGRYKEFINSDPILKQDFAMLMKCSEDSGSMNLRHYQKITNHLIAEADEAAKDNQRMGDESPVCLPEPSDACKHVQEQRDLKNALDTYQVNYLAG